MGKAIGMTFSVGARLQSSVSGVFDTLDGRVSRLKRDLKTTRAVANAAGKLTSAKATVDSLRAQAAAGKDVGEKLKSAERAYASAARSAAKYNISVKDSARVHAKAAAQMARTEASLKRQEIYQRNRAKRGELKGEIMGTVASVAAITAPVKMAADFEDSFSDLQKAADFANPNQEAQIKKDILGLSQKTGLSATDITSIATSAAESGVIKDADGNVDREAMLTFLTDASEMAVAFGISAEEAGERMKAFRTRMRLSADETREMTDAINYMGANMNATADATSQVVARMGGVGDMAGLSAKSVAALSATLVSTSESPEVAGTAFKNFLLTLSKGESMTKKQKDTLIDMGVDVSKLTAMLKKGGEESEKAILGVLQTIQQMPETAQSGIANDLFGTESLASIAPLINDLGKLKKAFALAHSDKAKGSSHDEFVKKSQTTYGALNRLKSTAAALGITVGTVLLPSVTSTANTFTELLTPVIAWVQANPRVVTSVMRISSVLAAFKVASLSARFAATFLSDGMTMARGAMAAFRVVTLGLSKALRVVTVAQWLLNAVMSNNPIGWVIKGVMFLGGVLYGLYKKCEPVRKFFDTLWDGFLEMIKPVTSKVEWVWDKIKRIIKWFKGDDVNEAEEKADKKLAEIDEKKKAAAAGKPVARSTAPVSDPDEDGFSSASGSEIKGRGKAAATVKPVVRTTAPVSVPDEDGFSSASGEENDAAMQAYIDSAALEAGSMPDISDMDMEDMGVSDAEISKLDVQAMSSGESGGTVTIAPTFKFEFSLDGIPDREFGKRVVDSVEREKNAIQRILSDLLRDADRRAYG